MFWIKLLKRAFPTSVATVPCILVGLVFTSFSLFVAYFQLSFLTTTIFIPGTFLTAFIVTRMWRGSPYTLRGVRTSATLPQTGSDKNAAKKKKPFNRFQLVAMPVNHYGEKLRWSMDLIGAPYEESTVGGIISASFRGRSVPWLVDKQSCSIIGNSDECMMYLAAVYVPTIMDDEQRAKCEAFFRRTPETMRWEQQLSDLGHCVQGWAYSYLLALDAKPWASLTAWGGFEPKVPWFDRLIVNKCHSIFKNKLREGFKLSDDKVRDIRFTQIKKMMADVDAALQTQKASGGTATFICGDTPTYIDVAFASLIAPTFTWSWGDETNYCNGRFSSFRGAIAKHGGEWPQPLVDFETDSMKRPSGQHVIKMYKELRTKKIWEL